MSSSVYTQHDRGTSALYLLELNPVIDEAERPVCALSTKFRLWRSETIALKPIVGRSDTSRTYKWARMHSLKSETAVSVTAIYTYRVERKTMKLHVRKHPNWWVACAPAYSPDRTKRRAQSSASRRRERRLILPRENSVFRKWVGVKTTNITACIHACCL